MSRRSLAIWWVASVVLLVLFMRVATDASWGNAIGVGLIVGFLATAAEATKRRRQKD